MANASFTEADIDVPEVESVAQRGRFFKDDNGRDLVEISFVGQKDTIVHYVEPIHMARYKREWDAYCDKQPLELRKGTPLSTLFDEKTENTYVAANIHNLEELAALDDMQCQGVGRGTITNRQAAREKLIQMQFDADQERRRRIDSMPTTALSTAPSEPSPEIGELQKAVGEIKDSIQTLQKAMLLLVQQRQEEPPAVVTFRRKRKGWPKGRRRKPQIPAEAGSQSDPPEDAA